MYLFQMYVTYILVFFQIQFSIGNQSQSKNILVDSGEEEGHVEMSKFKLEKILSFLSVV